MAKGALLQRRLVGHLRRWLALSFRLRLRGGGAAQVAGVCWERGGGVRAACAGAGGGEEGEGSVAAGVALAPSHREEQTPRTPAQRKGKGSAEKREAPRRARLPSECTAALQKRRRHATRVPKKGRVRHA